MASKREILQISLRASDADISNIKEGVKLHSEMGFFYKFAERPLPDTLRIKVAQTTNDKFKTDYDFVGQIFRALERTNSTLESVYGLLQTAKNNSGAKRSWALMLTNSILAYLQVR